MILTPRIDLLSNSLHFPVRTPPTILQVSSRKEFDVNWEGVSTAHDGVNCINWTPSTGSLARLLTKHNIRHCSFNSCYKTVFRNSFTVIRTYLTRASYALSFMFVVYGFDLIVKVWFVFIVLSLEVPGRFW